MRKQDTVLTLITAAFMCLPLWSTARGGGPDRTDVLNVDGIVKVKGLPMEGARMRMMERDGAMEVLDKGLGHFAKELPLQTAVLMVFEREGCVTKQLYFDTHVPSEALDHAPFDFPFQVTLEAMPGGQQFEYAGPVGYIRYYPERNDFGYDTDYSRKADPMLTKRMELAMTNVTTTTPSAEPASAPAVALPLVEPPKEDTGAFHVLVPTRPSQEMLVHPTGTASSNSSVVGPSAPPPPAVPVKQEATPGPPSAAVVKKEAPPPATSGTVVQVKATVSPMHDVAVVERPIEQAPATKYAEGRQEELIVEKNRVTKIVRIAHEGRVDEYRRVSHLYGAVHYFKNGESCSDLTYEQGTE